MAVRKGTTTAPSRRPMFAHTSGPSTERMRRNVVWWFTQSTAITRNDAQEAYICRPEPEHGRSKIAGFTRGDG